jgi:hypothetical protein
MIRYLLARSSMVITKQTSDEEIHKQFPNPLGTIRHVVAEAEKEYVPRQLEVYDQLERKLLPVLDSNWIPYHFEIEGKIHQTNESFVDYPGYSPFFRDHKRYVQDVFVVLYSENDAFFVRMHCGVLPE